MPSHRRKPRQLELVPRSGRTGRPRTQDPGVAHRPRLVAAKLPLHVTVRMAHGVWNLRSQRSFRIIEKALYASSHKADARICHFSVQGNHIHLLVEATDARNLASMMRSLNTRLGMRLNRMMKRRGRVVAERYHARSLRTPTEVRRARDYVLHNHRKHAVQYGAPLPASYVDSFSSEASNHLPRPVTWLLSAGWRRGSPTK